MPTTFENQRDLLRCLCRRHNIGTYTPGAHWPFNYDAHLKFTCNDSRAITSKPNLVGPFGFIQANEDDSFKVCVTSTWPWTKYDLPRVTRREVVIPGRTVTNFRRVKRKHPDRRWLSINGGDPRRELEALKAIGHRPLHVTPRDIREQKEREEQKRIDSLPHVDPPFGTYDPPF
jgi:hypothetical protein